MQMFGQKAGSRRCGLALKVRGVPDFSPGPLILILSIACSTPTKYVAVSSGVDASQVGVLADAQSTVDAPDSGGGGSFTGGGTGLVSGSGGAVGLGTDAG